MPLDLEPAEDGNIALLGSTDPSGAPLVIYVGAAERDGRDLFKSHFATCPQAASHRR